MVGRVVAPPSMAPPSSPAYPTMAATSMQSIYEAYPLQLRSHLMSGPPPLELSQTRLVSDDTMAAQRMRELFDRPTAIDTNLIQSNEAVSSPVSRDDMQQRTERRSGNMCSRLGKFHGEVYETKERSRVINALKHRSRANVTAANQHTATAKFTADDVLRAGTLTKQGSWRRNWKSRFFLLRRDYPSLCYYKSEEKLELLGSIAITGDTIALDKSPGGHAPYRFLLRTDDASLLLEAETQDNQQRWMDAVMELADAVRAEKYRLSMMVADRDPTTAAKANTTAAVSRMRHSLVTTSAAMSIATTPGRIRKSTPDNQVRHSTPKRSDLDPRLLDNDDDDHDDNGSSSEDEDNQKEDDDDDDDDIWSMRRSNRVVDLADAPLPVSVATSSSLAQTQEIQQNRRASIATTVRQPLQRQFPPGRRTHDLVLELVVGRPSKLLTRSESSNDKMSCCVKVVGYSSPTKESVEIGLTDSVKLMAAAQSQVDPSSSATSSTVVRVPFLIVLPADLSRFDQLRFTLYRTSSGSLSRTMIGLGCCVLDDAFRDAATPRLMSLTEKSTSFPDVLLSSSSSSSTLRTLNDARGGLGGSAGSLPISMNSMQLTVQAFPSIELQSLLRTSGIDMASAKYLLPTTLHPSDPSNQRPTGAASDWSRALIDNGSFLPTTSASPQHARRIVVDEILRTPRSTFALPLAFLDYLEETAVRRTHARQKEIETGDESALLLLELEFYRKKQEEYMRQRQFLRKQEKRLLDEADDHKIFYYAIGQVARLHTTKRAASASKLDTTDATNASADVVAPFKRSTDKSIDRWQFLPTNLHDQFLFAHQPPGALLAWHTMTMGCPAAHSKGFASGGYPVSAPVVPTDHLPTAGSDDDNESDDAILPVDRVSSLGTQVENLRRRTSLNRTSTSSAGSTAAENSGGADALRSKLELHDRLDIIASQTLSAAVACVLASLDLAVAGSEFHRLQLANAARCGFLIHFESLLSTQGKEVGMLEDFAAGTRWLRRVFIQFRRSATTGAFFAVKNYSPPERRTLPGGTGVDGAYSSSTFSSSSSTSKPPAHVLVTVGVSESHVAVLPALLASGRPFRVRCVLFTQGVNEKQSLVHALKSQTVRLQDQINRANLAELQEIYAIFRRDRLAPSLADARGRHGIRRDSTSMSMGSTLDALLAQIESHVLSSAHQYKKNVALLMDTSDFCRALGGARVTCCKSGKDRTAMAVTLEQARLCVAQLQVAQGQGEALCATMRVLGVRRQNVVLNTGSHKFAFNEVQRKMLPDCYKPPLGTYKSGKT